MRAVIQRVSSATVSVSGREVGAIGPGLLVFIGIHRHDTDRDLAWMADKVINLRIFEDQDGKMNRSLIEQGGEMLVVSQFTLYGDCRKGRRPGYSEAAPPDMAERLYHDFINTVTSRGVTAATGQFQAMMNVALVNDGPVTLLVDSAKQF